MLTFELRLSLIEHGDGDGDLPLGLLQTTEAEDRVLALFAVLLLLATTTAEVLELYRHVFPVGVALGVSIMDNTY